VDNPDNTITAVIQIMYEGPSDDFAWVLPVPGTPKVAVSSDAAFRELRRLTDPVFRVQFTSLDCGTRSATLGNSPGFADAGTNGGPVTVRASGAIGPYDYRVIEVTPGVSDPAKVGLDWLSDNGFDVGDLAPEVLRPYLEDGLNLLAFKLTKDSDSGSIRPVMITYDAELASIPIRPTAVAAEADMGVLVFLLSDARAVPQNYKALVLNETLIDWFNPMNNYGSVVSRAADEAQGQGFVTEFAGKHESLAIGIFTRADELTWEAFRRANTDQATDADVVQLAVQNWNTWQGFDEALATALTAMPAQVTLESVKLNPRGALAMAGVVFDRALFIEKLAEWVIDPLDSTQQLFETRPYLTRLYTTMSPPEMTMDPSFTFNPDLDDVSNVHVAQGTTGCTGSNYSVQLPSGQSVNGAQMGIWPLGIDAAPAALRIMEYGTSGRGRVLEDRGPAISRQLTKHNRTVSGPRGDGCATVQPGAAAPHLLAPWIAAIALLGVRRRRR
jgi:hypothetical protein